jgi:hypothetical protein
MINTIKLVAIGSTLLSLFLLFFIVFKLLLPYSAYVLICIMFLCIAYGLGIVINHLWGSDSLR